MYFYDYDKNLQFYSNLSGAYEPPTFSEVRQLLQYKRKANRSVFLIISKAWDIYVYLDASQDALFD